MNRNKPWRSGDRRASRPREHSHIRAAVNRGVVVALVTVAVTVLAGALPSMGASVTEPAPSPANQSNGPLYVCYYTVNASNIRVFYTPAAAPLGTTHKGDWFRSVPYQTSGTIQGQRWIYGIDIPPFGGPPGLTGYIGRNYLTLQDCLYR